MLRKILISAVLVLLPHAVFAHGDSHGGSSAKAKKLEVVRSTATKPASIASLMIQTILDGASVPSDVLLLRCSINESAPCRGMSISLSSTAGSHIVTGHSGLDGWVGFEGLSPSTEYKIKIQSAKYGGEYSARAGEVQRILASRISEEKTN
ncbi:hypothetical protein BH10BDE1_BH10BDE1_28280 [soil metagenome]